MVKGGSYSSASREKKLFPLLTREFEDSLPCLLGSLGSSPFCISESFVPTKGLASILTS